MAAENGANDASDLEKNIIKQVEYYFGDMNLPRDRFLQDQISHEDGWVTLETMLKFNRLKQLSEDQEVIANALEKSESGLVEVSEDKKKIRRSPDKPIPENTKERREEIAGRSVYAENACKSPKEDVYSIDLKPLQKGFPQEHTLDQLQEFFAKHGKIENILMRRVPKTKVFKGSVFVVFKDKEDAEKFVKAESLKCGETELIRHFKDDYFKKKNEEKKQMKKQHSEEVKEQDKEKDDKLKEKYKKLTILRLDGLPTDIPLEDIRNFFSDFGTVAWVDHDKGDTKGFVRFKDENEATEVLTKAKESGEGKIEINNNEVEAKVLDGEEELNHWKLIFKTKDDMRRNRNPKGGNRHHRGKPHGGYRGKKRSFNRGNRGGGDADKAEGKAEGEPEAKAAKAND